MATGWEAALIFVVAGLIGGLVNAATSDDGFVLYRAIKSDDGKITWHPGLIGGLLISAVAALLSWTLYGADAGKMIFGEPLSMPTLSAVGGALLTGIGGSRWLTAEVDKILSKRTAILVAGSQNTQSLVQTIANQSPAQAMQSVLQHIGRNPGQPGQDRSDLLQAARRTSAE